jgi:hypothetical protein
MLVEDTVTICFPSFEHSRFAVLPNDRWIEIYCVSIESKIDARIFVVQQSTVFIKNKTLDAASTDVYVTERRISSHPNMKD